jgi:hypothetical protein
MPPSYGRYVPREQFSLHFGVKTKMLALTIMAIKKSQPRLPFHVAFNAT